MAIIDKRASPAGLPLRKRLELLVKDSVLYGGAAGLNKCFGLITFPLLTRYFTVEDYGTIDFFTVIASVLTVGLVFGQDSAVARFYYEYTDDKTRREIIAESLVLQLSLALLILFPLWCLAGLISRLISQAPEAHSLFKLVLAQVPCLIIINFTQNLLKWTFSRTPFLIISTGPSILSALLIFVAVVWFKPGIIDVLFINLGVQLVFCGMGLYFCNHWISLPRTWSHLRDVVCYAVPYGVICVIGAWMPVMERGFVSQMLGNQDLGLYAAGAKIAMLIMLPISAFETAWGPFALAIHREPDARVTYNWVLKFFSLGICLASILLTLAARPAINFLASARYAGAHVVIFPLTMGLAVQSIAWIACIGIDLSKKTYLNLYSYFIFLALSAISISVLAHSWGLAGVAWGVLVGHFAKSCAQIYFSRRAHPLVFSLTGPVLLVAMVLGCGLLDSILPSWILANLCITLVFIVPCCAGFGFLVLFSSEERKKLVAYSDSLISQLYRVRRC